MHSYKMLMLLPSLIFTGLMNRVPCHNRLKTKEMPLLLLRVVVLFEVKIKAIPITEKVDLTDPCVLYLW